MAAIDRLREALIVALGGISTFAPPPMPGPQLTDESVQRARMSLGGQLEPIPHIRLRWYPPDIEKAQRIANNGDMTLIGQLNESMKIDGVYRGLMDARTSVVNFPKRYYGSDGKVASLSNEIVSVLQSRSGSDRDVYDEMIPATEARLMTGDGTNCGVAVGEMVPVRGRDFPVLVRRFPQNLYYLWTRNQWYYRSIVGLMPITPGRVDPVTGSSWVLHLPGGRLAPWNNGTWNTAGRSYINKTQSIFARQSYEMKHSHPARVAFSALGSVESERDGMMSKLIRWAMNAAFVLTPGWDIKLIESNGRGIDIYEHSIKTYNEEIATALCGSAVMLQGTAGFSNMDVFRVVQTDLITTTADAWDHTVNTQILPSFIALRWGVEALADAITVKTDTLAPKDRASEASTMVALASAIKGLVEAVDAAKAQGSLAEGVVVNVLELLARYGIPTEQKAANVSTDIVRAA